MRMLMRHKDFDLSLIHSHLLKEVEKWIAMQN